MLPERVQSLVARILAGEKRAVARAMSLIENEAAEKRELLKALYPYAGRAHLVGFTGSPGAGKSTLVDGLIRMLRQRGIRVGVLAVDPSSPFTGGALLGDRVRMTEHSADEGVYIRSVGSRGNLGGLGKSSREMLYPLEAYGLDVIILETVGVGQSELDILGVADSVALVLTPGAGDSVQTAKAGIMEIADVFVINKADFPGADTLHRELQLMIHDKRTFREHWKPPIMRTVALKEEGIALVWEALSQHRSHLNEYGFWAQRRSQRHVEDALRQVEAQFHAYLHQQKSIRQEFRDWLSAAAMADPYDAADAILTKMSWPDL